MWCIGCGCGRQNSKIKEKACKQMFTGHARQLGGGAGLAQSLVWSLGRVVDMEGGVVTLSSPEYTRMEKKPCRLAFTKLGIINTSLCLVWIICHQFVAPVKSSGEVP